MRGLIQLNDDKRLQRCWVAHHEVQRLGCDLVSPSCSTSVGLLVAGEPEQLPQRDLSEDVSSLAYDALQHPEEICLGVGDKVLVDLNLRQRRATRGGAFADPEETEEEPEASRRFIRH